MKKWITLTLFLVLILYVGCNSSEKPTQPLTFRGSKWLSSPEEVIKGETITLEYQTLGDKICPKVLYGITGRDTVWYGFQNDSLVVAGYKFHTMRGSIASIEDLINEYIRTDSDLVKKYGRPDTASKSDTVFTSMNMRLVLYNSIRHIGDDKLCHVLFATDASWVKDKYMHVLSYYSKWYREIEKY
ncbi:MAG: hypothetical protein NT002_12005 [candidate division Zixibacteria bacterium]|nr:hypothetical protein [candidate division Zixibacteria bacterium]